MNIESKGVRSTGFRCWIISWKILHKTNYIQMKYFFIFLLISTNLIAQPRVDISGFDKKGGQAVEIDKNIIEITWPAGEAQKGKAIINMEQGQPLFKAISLTEGKEYVEIASGVEPVFILTRGKRDLTKESGWNIFFDR